MRPQFVVGIPLLALAALPAFAEPAELWRIEGLAGPESVARDPQSGMIFVSLMGQDPMAKDGDGAIAVIRADGTVAEGAWLTGLDAPKGMDATGGHLFAADIDRLVEIDIASAKVVASHPVEGAVMLNDVVALPDGRVFVSDTMTNTVHLLQDGAVTPFASGPMLTGVNGLAYVGDSLVAADLGDLSGGFENIKPGLVVRIDLATKAMSAFGAEGPVGILDGVEGDGAGGLYLTDYMQGKVLHLDPGGTPAEVAKLATGAADLEFLPEAGLILVPVTPLGSVVALKLP